MEKLNKKTRKFIEEIKKGGYVGDKMEIMDEAFNLVFKAVKLLLYLNRRIL